MDAVSRKVRARLHRRMANVADSLGANAAFFVISGAPAQVPGYRQRTVLPAPGPPPAAGTKGLPKASRSAPGSAGRCRSTKEG